MYSRIPSHSSRPNFPFTNTTLRVSMLSDLVASADTSTQLRALRYLYGGAASPEIAVFAHLTDEIRGGGSDRGHAAEWVAIRDRLVALLPLSARDARSVQALIRHGPENPTYVARKMQSLLSAMHLCLPAQRPEQAQAALQVLDGDGFADPAFDCRLAYETETALAPFTGDDRAMVECEFHETVERILLARLVSAVPTEDCDGQQASQKPLDGPDLSPIGEMPATQATGAFAHASTSPPSTISPHSIETATTVIDTTPIDTAPISTTLISTTPISTTPIPATTAAKLQKLSGETGRVRRGDTMPVITVTLPDDSARADIPGARNVPARPRGQGLLALGAVTRLRDDTPMRRLRKSAPVALSKPHPAPVIHTSRPVPVWVEALVDHAAQSGDNAEPAWGAIVERLKAFYRNAPEAIQGRKALLERRDGGLFNPPIWVVGKMAPTDGWRHSVQRQGRLAFGEAPRAAFGWTRSAVAEEALRWKGQSAALMLGAPLLRTNGEVIDARILCVSSPTLPHAVAARAFDSDAYRTALASNNQAIMDCVKKMAPSRVVLTAFGGARDVAGLPAADMLRAEKIARKNMVALVRALQERGMPIMVATDDRHSPFWKKVCKALGDERDSLVWSSDTNPANWMQRHDLLVNRVAAGQFAGQPLGDDVDAHLGHCSMLLDAHVFTAAIWDAHGTPPGAGSAATGRSGAISEEVNEVED